MEEREYNRLIQLIESGRKFHYRNFVFAALIFVLSLKDAEESLSLFLNVDFPIKYLQLFLYIVIVVFNFLTIDIYRSIDEKVFKEFKNEVPFNWVVFTGKKNSGLAIIFIITPLILSTGFLIYKDPSDLNVAIILFCIFFSAYPTYLKNFLHFTGNKLHTDGSTMTLSHWIHDVLSFISGILFRVLLILAIQDLMTDSENFSNSLVVVFWLIIGLTIVDQIIIISGFISRRINRYGLKHGFVLTRMGQEKVYISPENNEDNSAYSD